MKRLLLLLAFLVNSCFVLAAHLKIKVVDHSTGESIPYAQIFLYSKDDTLRTLADFDGDARLTVDLGKLYLLKVSSLGYEVQSEAVKIKAKSTYFEVAMKVMPYLLECVLITEYSDPLINYCGHKGNTISREDFGCVCCRRYQQIESVDSIIESGKKEVEPNLKAFPNPTSDVVNITSNSESGFIYLYDCTGKLLQQYENVMTSKIVDLSPYAPGIYFIKAGEGENALVERIVKQ